MSRHFLEFKLHLLSFENQINKVEGTKAWGKSPFVTYTDAYTSTYYLDMYTFLKSIYASLNFHMCLQNMTPPKFLWVLCCVRYDKIVFQFFCCFFCIFSFCCVIFFLFVFFSFLQRCISLKKKRNKIYIKKEIPGFFLLVVNFLLIKGDGQLDRHGDRDKQISWLTNTNYRREKEVKYVTLHTWSKSDNSCFVFLLHRAVEGSKKTNKQKYKKTMIKWKKKISNNFVPESFFFFKVIFFFHIVWRM